MRVLYTDGGSLGNGRFDQRARMSVFDDALGTVVVDSDLGALTNNEAEYRAIEAALDYAAVQKLGPVEVRSDSQLCVNQIKGLWKVKEPRLQPLVERARRKLAANGGKIAWIGRDRNPAGRNLEGLEPLLTGPSFAPPLPLGEGRGEGLPAPYCQRCGTLMATKQVDHRPRPVCPKCSFTLFEDPKLAVAAVLELDAGIVLCKRAIEPGLGKWSFPAGFVDRGEEHRGALIREIAEETGLVAELGGLVGVYSEAGNPVVLVVYAAQATGQPRPSAEASEVRVFRPDSLPEPAFTHDRQILADWSKQRA